MPLMTIDPGATSPAGKESPRLTPAAGTSPQSGSPGATQGASPKAFGQLMAEAFRQNHPHAEGAGDVSANGQTETGEPMALAPTGGGDGQNLASTDTPETDTKALKSTDVPLLPDWLQAMTQPLAVQPMTPGSSLQVITPSTPAPDEASLIAFAQAQGLDAQAIALLLQRQPAQGQAWMHAAGLTGQAGPTAQPGGAQALMPMLAAGAAPMPFASVQTASLTGTPGNVTPPMPAGTSPGSAATTQPVTLPAALAGAAAWISTTPHAGKATTPAMNSSDNPGAETLPALDQNPMLAGLRRALTGNPATGSVSRPPDNWTFTQPQTAHWSESELDLGTIPGVDDAAAASDTAPPTSALLTGDSQQPPREAAAPSPTLGSASSTAAKTEGSNTAQAGSKVASDQMQQLGEQMADAVGERMMREIERGHWNLRLMLKPAHLGHIEVEMRLHAGGLDASFTTSQAGTRELLQDGLDKLRESLNQMGMDIANFDVKTGQNRQNGEDPTPGQAAATVNPSSKDTAEQPTPNAGWTPRPRRPDGWDVMV